MSNILLVDDDVDLAEMVQTKLVAEGHQVVVTNSGTGAFELAKQVKPQIAILDIMLPGITGYQICRKLRKDPELYKMAILILTALGEEPEILHGLEQGADDYLTKPFRLQQLLNKLEGLGALLQSIDRRNPITNLPGTEAVKREINLRLVRDVPVAAVYLDVAGFKPYCAARGAHGQKQTLEFIARMLIGLTRSLGIYESFISHMGGEHFVVVLNLEDYETFCQTLLQTFDRNVQELYTQQELSQGAITATDKNGREVRCPLMALSVGVAHTQCRKFRNAKQMFEVLAQVGRKARPEGKSSMFVDRRKADR